MPIEVMDKKSCATLSGEATLALQQVLKKYGVDVEYVGGSYSPEEFNLKFAIRIPRSDGIPPAFAKACGKFGLDPSDYKKRFRNDSGTTYELVGIKPQNRKYPIIGLRSDGKRFKFSSRVLAAGLH
jgi:hypothetical protein